MQPEKRKAWLMPTTLPQSDGRGLSSGHLLGDLLGGEHARVGAADHIEGRVLYLRAEGGGGVFHHRHAVLAVHAAHDGGEHADVRHGTGEHEMGHAASAQGRIERGPVETVVVVLGHHELIGPRGEVGHDVHIGLAEETRGGGPPEPAWSLGRGAPMLGVEQTDEQRHRLRVGELGEDDGEALVAEEGEERLDLGDDVASGGDFHGLARVEEGALHVDDEQRSLVGSEPQCGLEGGGAVHVQLSSRLGFGSPRTAHSALRDSSSGSSDPYGFRSIYSALGSPSATPRTAYSALGSPSAAPRTAYSALGSPSAAP